jgi:hypothetical protein
VAAIRARAVELVEQRRGPRAETLVLQRRERVRRTCVQERALVAQRRVVDQAGDAPAVVADLGQHAGGIRRRRIDGATARVDPVPAAGREPVQDLHLGVSERVRERAAQLLRGCAGDPAAGEPMQRGGHEQPPAQQAGKERERQQRES